ncbi:MAG TPA: hypothetical protein VF605_11590 [Allosphingosinicella sp.]|jgi:hypothetical protein
MTGRSSLLRAVTILAAASAWAAQAGPPPDPAGVSLPDLTAPADQGGDADPKYYYFRMAGVSYSQAYEDFSECYRYLPSGAVSTLPMFAPWRDKPGIERVQPTYNYGLVGMGIAALFLGPLQRKARQAPVRRCLETRGYVRYPLTEKAWKELVDGYSERSVAMQAKAASTSAAEAAPVAR